jgi:tRNA threonylcarbamoyladenosine biosynthesis protein TsaE
LTTTEAFLVKLFSASPEETIAIGEDLALRLPKGAVVALRGGLGAGKTCLTKGIARGLGITEEITSPTYTIISEYEAPGAFKTEGPGPFPLYHIDAYRLAGDDDFAALGGEEYLGGQGITVIEWSERIPASLPHDAVTVDIRIDPDERRCIEIQGLPAGAETAIREER